MPYFRKRPVVIEAMRFDGTGESQVAIKDWAGDAVTATYDERDGFGVRCEAPGIEIATLEGVMRAAPGDWIIRGVAGEMYPCKPDVFERTYESA